MNIDRTPPPVSLAAALALPRTPGRSAEVFFDGDLEVRFAARPTNGPQVPHQRDEFYPRFFPSADRKSGPDRGKVTRDNRRRILLTSCPSFSWRSPQPCRRPGVLGRERRIPALFGGIAALQASSHRSGSSGLFTILRVKRVAPMCGASAFMTAACGGAVTNACSAASSSQTAVSRTAWQGAPPVLSLATSIPSAPSCGRGWCPQPGDQR